MKYTKNQIILDRDFFNLPEEKRNEILSQFTTIDNAKKVIDIENAKAEKIEGINNATKAGKAAWELVETYGISENDFDFVFDRILTDYCPMDNMNYVFSKLGKADKFILTFNFKNWNKFLPFLNEHSMLFKNIAFEEYIENLPHINFFVATKIKNKSKKVTSISGLKEYLRILHNKKFSIDSVAFTYIDEEDLFDKKIYIQL